MNNPKPLLPPNAKPSELALEATHAERIESLPVPIKQIQRPFLTPRKYIPWLAWDKGVTWWEDDWTDIQKRDVIRSAAEVNKRRGTPGALKRALSATDISIDVIEWFQVEPKAPPYTFGIKINGFASGEDLINIRNLIKDTKNVRSFLSSISINPQEVTGEFFVGGAITGTVTTYMGTI